MRYGACVGLHSLVPFSLSWTYPADSGGVEQERQFSYLSAKVQGDQSITPSCKFYLTYVFCAGRCSKYFTNINKFVTTP